MSEPYRGAQSDDSTEAPVKPDAPPWARTAGAVAGSHLGSAVAGLLSGALRVPEDRAGAAVREGGLFVPLAALGFLASAPLVLALTAKIRARITRGLTAPGVLATYCALAAAVPPSIVLWVAVSARLGQRAMAAFHHPGLTALALAVGILAWSAALTTVLALEVRFVARRAPLASLERPAALPGALALGALLALALGAVGVRTGDVDGHGGFLGALGVLRRPELDLTPVYGLGAALALSAIFSWVFSRRSRVSIAALAAAVVLSAALFRHAATHFADAPSAAVIEARPGLARSLLRVLRKRFDRDRDGAAALFGGGDCDDRDPRRSPDAIDAPGNGVDEDCSGADAPIPAPRPSAAPPPPGLAERIERALPRDANLLLITVDTLRWDLHYAGNPRELSPNLDRLAAQSIVFDRAYALSSYTGRAVGPLLAGRYPTECARDSEHFTRYLAPNVLLAERLSSAGFRTVGAASHFYFERRFGLTQGMDVWDLSAEPGSDGQESTSTDARVADRAIALLNAPESRGRRLFLWTHFFDPHKQYVPHPELGPPFGSNERARYDAEVAWTDRQIGRLLTALDASPFAQNTIVVVTADHGEAFGEHGMSWHGVELWEELVRVPLLVRVPGIAPRHITERRSQIDLAPTLMALLRLPAPAADAPDAFSGESLVPEFLGEPAPRRPIYIELPEGPFNSLRRALIVDDWKLLERGSRRFLLFDLATDPGERSDAAARDPARLGQMRTEYERVRAGLHTVPAVGE